MLLRRPTHVRFEYRESPQFSLESLVSGGDGLEVEGRWLASTAHLDDMLELDIEDLALFQAVPEEGVEDAALATRHGAERIARLLSLGLLLGDAPKFAGPASEDARVRAAAWWGPAAIAHREGRWRDIDVGEIEQAEGKRRVSRMIEENGLPPTQAPAFRDEAHWLRLPAPASTGFDELLRSRSTCRNFAPDTNVPLADLATMLKRVFGAQASQELAPGATMLKKNSPSGGGLHPIEAFVLVQRVDSLAPGLYHYQCVEHALEPLQAMDPGEAARAAHELVAGQAWFANAPVLLLMAARFDRTFWKYRNHAKAWKVIQLDAGHLSQNFYLSATEMGYGAFITGAINDHCAERLFGLEPMRTGAIAVCGFGKRAPDGPNVEFDPLDKKVR